MGSRWTWVGGAAIVAAVVFWLLQEGAVQASDVKRRLSDAKLHQMPLGVDWPEAWQEELRQAIARAPELSLLAPEAPSVAAEVLKGVSWISPQSVRAELRMPEGIDVRFLPRQARLMLIQNQRPVGVLAADGHVLPDGLPVEMRVALLQVELEPGDQVPAPGRPIASRVAQEALRAFLEVVGIEEAAGIRVIRVQPQGLGSTRIRSQAPGLRFLLANGCELEWGRSDLSRTEDEPSSEEKARRLGAVFRQYPDLQGVHCVVLDRPGGPLVLDADYKELPFDGVIIRPR